MPAIPSEGHILVTGANGFVGAHVCKVALDKGLTVTGTVRSAAKGDFLTKLYKSKRFNYEIVSDLSDLHGFDHLFKSYKFDGVLHVASPVTFDADDPDEMIIPALHGVMAVLNATRKYCPTVKRIVYTSSDAAVKQPSWPVPQRFDESNWNTESPEECRKMGRKAGQVAKYRASKAIAERAFWDYSKKHKDIAFDQVAINPTDVGGPIFGECTRYEEQGVIQKMFYDFFWNGSKTEADLPGREDNLVDVRDIALMHVKSLLLEQAGGERMIGAAMPFCWQDISNIMSEHAPEMQLPKGKKGGAEWQDSPEHCIIMDGSKAEHVLDFKYRSMQETVVDMYGDLKRRREKYGWPTTVSLKELLINSDRKERNCMSSIFSLCSSLFAGQSIRLHGEEQSLSEKSESKA